MHGPIVSHRLSVVTAAAAVVVDGLLWQQLLQIRSLISRQRALFLLSQIWISLELSRSVCDNISIIANRMCHLDRTPRRALLCQSADIQIFVETITVPFLIVGGCL